MGCGGARRLAPSGARRLAPSAGDQFVAGALVFVTGGLQQLAPGVNIRAAAEQRPALPLSHPTPHTELNAVVQRVREALSADGAAAADQLGPVLRRPLDEKLVRVRAFARGAGGPVRDPHVAQLLLIVTPARGRHAGWRSLAGRAGLWGGAWLRLKVAKT